MFAIGIDLGGTNARAALVHLENGSIQNESRSRLSSRDPQSVIRLCADLVRTVDPERKAVGVGIGLAAMLRDRDGYVLNAPNLGWRDVDFGALARRELRGPVTIRNDLKAITWGEAQFGAARGVGDLVCVFIGTGIGAGIILGNVLQLGAGSVGGEIGHMKAVEHGRVCGCGERGCLEAYVSGRNLAARAHEELAAQPFLSPTLAAHRDELTATMLDAAAAHGDGYADTVIRESASLLALHLGNLVTALNPTLLVMGGTIWTGCNELRRRTLQKLGEIINPPARRSFSIVDSTLGDAAGVLGAAALVRT